MESDICEHAKLIDKARNHGKGGNFRTARYTLKCRHPKCKGTTTVSNYVANERVKALKHCPRKRKYC